MEKLMELCDGVMLDVKSFNNDKHKKYIKFENFNVLKNLEYLASINKLYEVRTVVVPEIFNNEETVKEVSTLISKYDCKITFCSSRGKVYKEAFLWDFFVLLLYRCYRVAGRFHRK